MSEAKPLQQAQLGAGQQSLQLALQFGGQVCAAQDLNFTT